MRKEGWHVTRSAASKGLFDLIAIKTAEYLFQNEHGPVVGEGEIRLIQCKVGKSRAAAIKKVLGGDIKRFEGLYSVSVEVL